MMADDSKNVIDAGADSTKAGIDQAANSAKSSTDQMRDGAHQARQTFQERVVDPAKRTGEAMRASGQKMAEGSQTIGVKMIDQAEENAREAFNAMRAAAQAKDVSDVMRIQGEYMRTQSQRSMTQAREMGELIMKFGRDAVSTLRPDNK